MTAPASPGLSADALRHVRPAVRDILTSSAAFQTLDPAAQRKLAGEMVQVGAFLADPHGLATQELARGEPTLAVAQSEASGEAANRAAEDQGFAGEDFVAGAVAEGTEQFGRLVKKVDFPKFVGGLIQNVFEAIVDSSIRQMEAYGELLANVAKSVDQFAQDNITENNARDWLAQRFPEQLEISLPELSGGFDVDTPEPAAQPKLVAKGDDPSAVAASISRELQLAKPVNDLSDEQQELRLVIAARLQMARSRQQMLASMVMLGINRIVVTDGLINAKVLFDLRATDQAQRKSLASMRDATSTKASTESEMGYGAWFSPVKASMKVGASTEHMATVESSVDETSESKADVKAKLSGEVRVNFKSDYLPMEKLATPAMIAAIQGNAIPADPVGVAEPGAAAP